MSTISSNLRRNKRYLGLALLFLVALYMVLPQLDQFKASRHLLGNPAAPYLVLAIVCSGLTYFFAAATYCLLAFKPLGYLQTVVVQLAAMFVNKLLPAGVGALGSNYVYLKRHKHSGSQAGSVVAINNMLGLAGHTVLLALTFLLAGQAAMISNYRFSFTTIMPVVTALLIVLIASIVVWPKARQALKDLLRQLYSYRRRKLRLIGGLASSVGLTLTNVLTLYLCALALNLDIGFAAIMVIFTFGITLSTIVPTPGGLGGFEAGLMAGFIAYDTDKSAALASALLYRLITYWLAIVAGAIALFFAERRRYI